ncbi:deacetylase [Sulfolobus sp. A20]|uniref:histone deacetylase family protein n=1 Tax=Sulfolobaceae TaxID=118883 RepID=UPI000845DA13|nr:MULTISPECIES: histone deacetylase family protein [unclassified Sulfolobus]TRM76428.1 histone deacetylase family protein [Sulfolobus sp. A20-N-F8]TRM76652.1 histone deacetylase family protein [Sulfolobus sp. B5]TRN02451.1 histone deacetylase family protein [Sulfolobus sp. F1]TRN04199.1 histone deacetylase family protein [Sulfolobus sp. E1]AOL16298.1 deacetylase [Sulfolobus sp. A20]
MDELHVIYDEIYKSHYPRSFHVENPERLTKALSILREFKVKSEKPVKVEDPQIVHSEDYINLVSKSSSLEENLDVDTYVNKNTYEVALHALGGSLRAFELNGLALLRPPGHHAGINGRAFNAPTLGFCIFNNIAYPVKKLNLRKVVVIDFDVHYGNGTQEIFYDNPEVLHIDIHQDPRTLYPGTGFPDMVGEGEAEGTKVNLLIPPLGGDDLYEELFPIIESILDDFEPVIMAISAGFDAFKDDGLANVNATERTFYNFGRLSRRFSKRFAVLEGGYSVGLQRGLKSFLEGFLNIEKEYPIFRSSDAVRTRFLNYLSDEKSILRKYWSI